MRDSARVLAVDLGAASIRVTAVDLANPEPTVDVLHRWRHHPVAADGALRWDWRRIVAEVERGLGLGLDAGEVTSIGIDGWGVDYGLVDGTGSLVAAPHCYRDDRTARWREIVDRIGVDRLYEITGIQLMGINTIFQLAVHDRAELDRAHRLHLLPDLLVGELTGFSGAERSNASTTGLLDVHRGDWSGELIDAAGADRALFPDVVAAGTPAGSWRGVPVNLVGSHDTASAFLGMPGAPTAGTAFVSTGTWIIVGMERAAPDTSMRAREANFSNEAGAIGGFRFLKNVVGYWLVERCRGAWGDPPVDVLLDEAATVTAPVPTFDALDPSLVGVDDPLGTILAATGLPAGTRRGVVVRSVLESIAAGVRRVVDELAVVTGTPITRLAVVGGGTRDTLLLRLLVEHTSCDVVRGSPEATALGNAVVQGIATGVFDGPAAARRWLESTGERMWAS